MGMGDHGKSLSIMLTYTMPITRLTVFDTNVINWSGKYEILNLKGFAGRVPSYMGLIGFPLA